MHQYVYSIAYGSHFVVLWCGYIPICFHIFLDNFSDIFSNIHTTLQGTHDIDTTKESSLHYNDVIMDTMASQITSLTIVYSTVHSGVDQGKHQSSASLAFVRGIHRWPVNSPHKWPVTRTMFPFDDVIINFLIRFTVCVHCVLWATELTDHNKLRHVFWQGWAVWNNQSIPPLNV